MTVRGHNVIVCDDEVGKAVALDMNGNVVYEFMKPADDSGNWIPIKVCCDSRGFVYILWCSGDNRRRVIVQNSLDSENVLRVLPVDDNAFSVTVMKASNKERLLVATVNTGKLAIYDLVSFRTRQIATRIPIKIVNIENENIVQYNFQYVGANVTQESF
ncbi:hypothetical protein HOLleu_03718 [Holothuria leucospilota]|uniref:Uncharacterized protein n=1 Tax=Holothuria leucospilota TaxID=206669 RepID=A0A9Q1CSB6_HOLLE|nr:hypothetical protein HOLleu_03718 [Holothuria leucospilota]